MTRIRTLIVDDEPIARARVLSLLREEPDVDVVGECGSGTQAVSAIKATSPDLVFLDVQMPEMDGLETARQVVQRWPREKRPCLIAMTGNALMGDRERCLEAGMDDYISKPVRIAELQSALERWGPARIRKPDTSFFTRSTLLPKESLLDQSILAELREMPSSDGVSIVRELVDLFLEGAPQRIAQIQQTLNDPPKLAFHAHALKSMGLNLGTKRVVELSQKIEELGRSGKVTDAPDLLRELEIVFSQTKAHLLPLRDE
jgi:CheY-like chemotaxis protein/HPt (histidine-containing phosphotransfer) domain-containing protein